MSSMCVGESSDLPLSGPFESPDVYRRIPRGQAAHTRRELLESGPAYTDRLEAMAGPALDQGADEALYQQTLKDVDKFSSRILERDEVTEMMGTPHWRSTRRFIIYPFHNGEWRAIDDGCHSGHNGATTTTAKVHTSEPTFVAAVSRRFCRYRNRLLKKAQKPGKT